MPIFAAYCPRVSALLSAAVLLVTAAHAQRGRPDVRAGSATSARDTTPNGAATRAAQSDEGDGRDERAAR